MISLLEMNRELPYEEVCKRTEPAFFRDLNLDQYVKHVMEMAEDTELQPYFYMIPDNYETIRYRQEIARDLHTEEGRHAVTAFISGIAAAMRYNRYAEAAVQNVQKSKWRLDCILTYYQTIEDLCVNFNVMKPQSQALYQLHEELFHFLNQPDIQKLREKAESLAAEIGKLRYHITINKDKATFDFCYSDMDYGYPIRNALEHGNADPAPVTFRESPFGGLELAPLEEFILRQLERENRVLFRDLETFCGIKRDIITENCCNLLREFQFYLANDTYQNHLEKAGYPMNFPQIVKEKELYLDDCYDIVLAEKNWREKKEIVFNDIMKASFEKAIVVTGPNQGGKTTLARAFGQNFYLGMMGLQVPSSVAKLPYVTQIFTHFSCLNQETNVEGRLKSELISLRHTMDTVKSRSVVIMNELFTSAPSMDALMMSRNLLSGLLQAGSICFFVTHTYEVAYDDKNYVSLVATVVEDGSCRRTYRIIRKEADGMAYANSIVAKYKLDYCHINYRLRKNQ